MEKDYRYLATHDALTGAKNYLAYQEGVETMGKGNYSVVRVNICGLKEVNEKYGRTTGDMLLCDAADVLMSVYKNVYRLEGDDFVVHLGITEEKALLAMEDECVRRLLEKQKGFPFDTDGSFVYFGYGVSDGKKSYRAVFDKADEKLNESREKVRQIRRANAVRAMRKEGSIERKKPTEEDLRKKKKDFYGDVFGRLLRNVAFGALAMWMWMFIV